MGFLKPPSMPAPPPPVKPLPVMPDPTIEENEAAQEAMEKEKKIAKKKKGRASTILTSQQGLIEDANVVKPTLLS
tara:strand:- start:147 stop:371 length:225 start_codon:yes stop_codon:yes gene_type:complete